MSERAAPFRLPPATQRPGPTWARVAGLEATLAAKALLANFCYAKVSEAVHAPVLLQAPTGPGFALAQSKKWVRHFRLCAQSSFLL
jgi:hypothetical protein